MIEGMARIGFDVTHVYGLTEVYGPAAVCVKRPSWAHEPLAEQVRLNGRQGVRYVLEEGDDGARPGDHGGRRPTARPWARSCSAAISR